MHSLTNLSSHQMPPIAATHWRPGWVGNALLGPDLLTVLRRFEPINLAQMDHVALLDRIDTKYVLSMERLVGLLPALVENYRVLDINGIRLSRYQTLYFDTPDFALYMSHHAGARIRCKVRGRRYADTDRSFLEIKFKTHHNRTGKRRIETGQLLAHLTPDIDEFINAGQPLPIDARFLEPKLWNDYSRVTLVSKHDLERVTLDVNLEQGNGAQWMALPAIAIAEVKQADPNRNSHFIQQMHAANIHPARFSKYCVGVSVLYPNVKHNNFKPQLRLIEKIMRDNDHVQRTH